MAPVESDDEKTIAQVKTKKKPSTPTAVSKLKKSKKDEHPKENKKNVKKEELEKGNAVGNKREKKVYDLPGQKRDPPQERDPLRIFYESLYEQTPTSEMAAFWMMESGLLSLKEAERLYEKKMSGKNRKVVKETKSVTVKKKVEPSTPKTSNKKKITTVKKTTMSKERKKVKKEESSDNDEESSEEEDSEEESSLSQLRKW